MSTIEFNYHFEDLQSKLLPTAYRLTNNWEDAKDLIQETALRAFNNKDKFQLGTNFRAWVVTIMRNTFINFYRKKRNRKTSSEPSDSYVFVNGNHVEDNKAGSNLMMAELKMIVENLSATYRVPFMLYYEGYKYEEIAQRMGLPVGTIKSRIHFARKQLREAVGNRYPSVVAN